ncbi:MAG: ABC transporter permease [Chloroflexi bacterium]|nr:ABC transporter permease [Chloroflexota bacterium]MCL5107642.1 ABC transporter permease [Chloroflexota bacterium]
MLRYVLIRLVGLAGVLLVVSIVTFLLMHSIPGGPFDEGQMPLSEETRAAIARKYNLDKPLHEQYLSYMGAALRLDFGIPFQSPGETVTELIGRTWLVTAHLGMMTIALAIIVGLPLGIIAGVKQNTWIDYLATVFSLFGFITPHFVIAIGLILVFSNVLGWLPTGGWDEPRQWIMPTLAYAAAPSAIIARFTRASVVEVINADFVRTARAKGLGEPAVLLGHVLKNALIPMLTIAGPLVADLVTGSFFVETIFRVPGLGKYFTTSIFGRDYPMIMACTLLWAALIAFAFLITDILYSVVDPRITLGREKT